MISDENITIRTGEVADVSLLTKLMRRAFKEAYASCTRPEDLYAHMDTNFNEERQQRELGNPRAVTLLAVLEDQLIGYVQWLESPSPDCVKTDQPVHLERFYVLKNYWGAGIADELMKTCLAHLSDSSYTEVWLSCWTENERALKFYRRWGFSPEGTEPFQVGADLQTDFIMVRPI